MAFAQPRLPADCPRHQRLVSGRADAADILPSRQIGPAHACSSLRSASSRSSKATRPSSSAFSSSGDLGRHHSSTHCCIVSLLAQRLDQSRQLEARHPRPRLREREVPRQTHLRSWLLLPRRRTRSSWRPRNKVGSIRRFTPPCSPPAGVHQRQWSSSLLFGLGRLIGRRRRWWLVRPPTPNINVVSQRTWAVGVVALIWKWSWLWRMGHGRARPSVSAPSAGSHPK